VQHVIMWMLRAASMPDCTLSCSGGALLQGKSKQWREHTGGQGEDGASLLLSALIVLASTQLTSPYVRQQAAGAFSHGEQLMRLLPAPSIHKENLPCLSQLAPFASAQDTALPDIGITPRHRHFVPQPAKPRHVAHQSPTIFSRPRNMVPKNSMTSSNEWWLLPRGTSSSAPAPEPAAPSPAAGGSATLAAPAAAAPGTIGSALLLLLASGPAAAAAAAASTASCSPSLPHHSLPVPGAGVFHAWLPMTSRGAGDAQMPVRRSPGLTLGAFAVPSAVAVLGAAAGLPGPRPASNPQSRGRASLCGKQENDSKEKPAPFRKPPRH
jgi:hypothetical protein